MGDDLEPDQGAFLSFLNWLDRPGQVVRNLLTGHPGAAGRQALDFLGEIPDAVLPGNLIPDATSKSDYVSPHELVGMNEDTPWYYRLPTDIGLGIATDPLSLIGVGEVAGAARAGLKVGVPFVKSLQKTIDVGADVDPFRNIGRGYEALTPQPVQDALDPLWRSVRSTFGAERLTPEAEAIRSTARAAQSNINHAQSDALEEAFKGATPDDREAMFSVIRNVRRAHGGNGDWEELLKDSDPRNPIYDVAKQSDELQPFGGNIEPLLAGDSMLKVREERLVNPALDPLDEAVGLGGVVDHPPVPFLTGHELNPRPTAMWADEAADATRGIAYPPELRPEQFASGIDVANAGLLGSTAPRLEKFAAEDALGKMPEAPISGGDISRSAKNAADGISGWESDANWITDPLTGGRVRAGTAAPRVSLPSSVTDAINEAMGGQKAAIESMSVTSAPDVKTAFDTIDNQLKRWDARVDALGVSPDKADGLKAMLRRYLDVSHTQLKEGHQDFPAFFKPHGIDLERETNADYLMGMHDVAPDNELARDALAAGKPSSLKERSLRTGKDLAEFLNKDGVSTETDALRLAAARGGQQARIGMKATMGRDIIQSAVKRAKEKKAAGAELTDGETKALEADGSYLAQEGGKFGSAVDALLKEMPPEDAQVLGDMWRGLPPRSAPMGMLAKVTRPWKAAVVYGLAVPKVGSLFRNRLSAGPMTAGTPGAEAAVGAMTNPVNIARDVIGAVLEGLGFKGGSKVYDDLRQINDTFRHAGGRAKNVPAMLRTAGREDLASAVENNVLDSFVGAEKLEGDISRIGWKKWLMNIIESPARMFQKTEYAMRLQSFQKILESGKTPAEAAQLTSSALYDYGVNSAFNRTARDIIPFFQFQAKAIPQSAKWLARTPAIGVAADELFGQNQDEPIYPYLAEHTGFSLGHTPEGKLKYVGGFGLPMESLSLIPDFSGGIRGAGRDLERGVVSSANPLLKTGYEAISGRDPYFGTDAFGYSKVPLLGEAGDAGRLYNALNNAGVAPLAGAHQVARQIEAATAGVSGDHSLGETALDLLTGASVVDVDQTRALQQILQNELSQNPDVHKHMSLYQTDADPETKALLDQYHHAQAKLRAERQKAKAGGIL